MKWSEARTTGSRRSMGIKEEAASVGGEEQQEEVESSRGSTDWSQLPIRNIGLGKQLRREASAPYGSEDGHEHAHAHAHGYGHGHG
jgi:hypothetical protein